MIISFIKYSWSTSSFIRMMQGLQSFVRRHGYLLYNIDVDQDNPFYEPMETFSFVYFPNVQVLFSVYEHRSNSCLDNHRMTLKNRYSLCHQKHLQRKSVLREICTRRRLLWFKFWALCLPNIFSAFFRSTLPHILMMMVR